MVYLIKIVIYLSILITKMVRFKLKNDPGRLNQVSVFINREGVFYGQCSEICGILHSSMPIVIESVSLEKFLT